MTNKKNIFLYLAFLCVNISVYARQQKIKNSIHKSIVYLDALLKEDSINNNFKMSAFAYPNRILYYDLVNTYPKYFKNKTYILKNYFPIYDDDKSIFPFYNRLVDKNYIPNKDSLIYYLNTHYDLDMVMLWAIYSNEQFAAYKTEAVSKILQSYTIDSTQVRGFTHCALAIKWCKALNTYNALKLPEKTEQFYLTNTLEYLKHHPCYDDTGLEAILTLLLLDKKYLIDNRWIKEIINHQNKDGGWRFSIENNSYTSHQHPTILALIILTNYINIK